MRHAEIARRPVPLKAGARRSGVVYVPAVWANAMMHVSIQNSTTLASNIPLIARQMRRFAGSLADISAGIDASEPVESDESIRIVPR